MSQRSTMKKTKSPIPKKKNRLQAASIVPPTSNLKKSSKSPEKKVQIHFESTAEERKLLKLVALEMDMSMSDVWRIAFKEYCDKYGFSE